MDLDIRESGSVCTLKLKGRLVAGEPISQLKSAITDALSTGHAFLIFDLEETPFVDSTGIGALVESLRTTAKAGGNVKLVNPGLYVTKTLKMVCVLDLFEIFNNVDEAVAASSAS
ncbi:MAG TPA: STAS domain-containing protein [Terracidiphilus sp.]|nr:STAS domain-containing protein [Terracidiphilus sp.]